MIPAPIPPDNRPSITFSVVDQGTPFIDQETPFSALDLLLFQLPPSNEDVSVTNVPLSTSRGKFQPFHRKLWSFFRLKEGWDGYNAERPSILTIGRAVTTLTKLKELGLVPTNVSPSVEGGTSIYFIKGDKFADFEFFNSGDILAGLSDRVNEPVVLEVDIENIEATIERIRQFLND
ncbi:MAG TPA: hypothetical protein VF571_07030 [Pyrinomonadaceae bacterium]|jgi:hypothetical protein